MAATLLSPINLGKLSLKNRVVMPPLTRARAGTSKLANKYIADHYAMRASAGLLISEAVAVSEQGYGWYATPALYTEPMAASWKPVTTAVHEKGGKIFAQLWHMGRQSHSTHHSSGDIVAPSAIKVPGDGKVGDASGALVPYEVPRALETSEIPGLVNDYREATRLALVAGFDGVEVHSANGYLLDTFLQSSTNKRTDKYGGSIDNRARLLMEILESLTSVIPAERVGVRLSPNGMFGGMGSEDNCETFPAVAKMLSKVGLGYLHVMDGLGFGFHGKCRAVTLHEMKKNFEGPIIANVGLTKELAEGLIRSGAADLAAFGRLYMSNPDLVERFQKNLPLAPEPPMNHWWVGAAKPEDALDGYNTYGPYKQ